MIKKIKTNSPFYSIIKNKINSNEFAWYEGTTPTDYSPEIKFLYHEVITREEKPNSFLYEDCKNLLLDMAKQLNISITKIFRCCVNFTYTQECKSCDLHIDHDFPHKLFLVYLNTLDHAPTHICEEKYKAGHQTALPASGLKLMKHETILPEEGTFIYFDGLRYHANEYPRCGKQRKVIVCSFK